MKSLRWRIALWFALSIVAVLGVFVAVTYLHLRHELRVERWERAHAGRADWTLHGSYSEAEVDDIAGELGRLSLIYALPVAALALGIGYLLARRSFTPVADLNRQLQAIGAHSLTQRVRLARADREFQAIEANINALLGRLEEAFSHLTEYSAQVAHELRTPLTLLRLQVEDAAGRVEPALADSLQEELARLSEYVDQCLLLATAEQGRLAVKPEPVSLRPLFKDLLEAYELWAAQNSRVVTFVAMKDITVPTDPRYLRQMLHNLLTNAVKHGTGPIRVTLEKTTAGATCRIENAIASAAPDQRGSGVGLRVVHALANNLSCQVETAAIDGIHIATVRWPNSPDEPRANLR
jgi:signal transduction histidine kinase